VAATLALAGCPTDLTPPGDVSFGDYRITATLDEDGCNLDAGREEEGSFVFRARLAADLDGITGWLSVAQPTDAPLQQARSGRIEDGSFVFPTTAMQDLTAGCGCLVQVTETMRLDLEVRDDEEEEQEEENENENEGENGNGTGNGNGEEDAEEEAPPISGLPHPDHVVGLGGRLTYDLEDPGGCPAPEDDGCPLPCGFAYTLEGTRTSPAD
jgi:hypothetical protein